MTGLQLAILSGLVVATGAVLAVRALRPAPPSLITALAQLSAPPARDSAVPNAPTARRESRLPTRLAAVLEAHAGVRDADLAILGKTRAELVARKLALALTGFIAPLAVSIACLLLGLNALAAFPIFVGIAAAGICWMLPTFTAKEQAAAARAEFRTNLEFFLTLVAGERRARGSVEQALDEAADVSGSTPFLAMRRAIRRAALAGHKPWADLRALGEEFDVQELRSLADIAEVAADGAAVYNTLLATARQLRHAELSDARAEANQISERMSRPLGLLVFGLTLFVLVPFMLCMFGIGT